MSCAQLIEIVRTGRVLTGPGRKSPLLAEGLVRLMWMVRRFTSTAASTC